MNNKKKLSTEKKGEGFNPKHLIDIDRPDSRDFIAEFILGVTEGNLPDAVHWDTKALNQGAQSETRVACTCYTAYHLAKIAEEIEKMKEQEMNPIKGWEVQKLLGTSNAQGDYVQSALRAIVDTGVYKVDGNTIDIDRYAKIDKSAMKYWLAKGFAVYTSSVVTKTNFAKAKKNGTWTGKDGTVVSGHAWAITGYDSTAKEYTALNSYGPKWGHFKDGTFRVDEDKIGDVNTCYILYKSKDIQMIFKDFSEESVWAKQVQWALENGIITGVGESDDPKERLLKPNEPLTRLQAILVMYRFAKLFYNH